MPAPTDLLADARRALLDDRRRLVTPTGWQARCRGCGGVLVAFHGAAR